MQTCLRTALRKSLAHNPYRWRATPICNVFFAGQQQFRMLRSSFGYFYFNVLHTLIFFLRFFFYSYRIHQRSRMRAFWRINWHRNNLNHKLRTVRLGWCCLRRTAKNWHSGHSRRYVPASSQLYSNNYNAMKEQIGAVESVKAASDIVCSDLEFRCGWFFFNVLHSMLPSLER